MKKRMLWILLAAMLLLGSALPVHAAVEEDELQVTWYSQYRHLSHLYGTGRMLARGEGSQFALLDLYGNQITDFVYDAFMLESDGLATALMDGSWGRLDLDGKVVVPFQYELIADVPGRPSEGWTAEQEPYPEGLRSVNESGQYGGLGVGPWGFEDEAGELVVPYVFDAVSDFDGGFATVRRDGVYGQLKNPLNAEEASDWAVDEITQAREAGLLGSRTDSYYLYNITRLQFAELAVNLIEQSTGEEIEPAKVDRFLDADDLYARKAAAVGIVSGTGNGVTFEPDALITREQMATMLYRAMEYMGCSLETGELSLYADAGQVSPWARQAVGALTAAEILKGNSDGELSPWSYTTVEQAIVLVLRAYQESGSVNMAP